MLPPATATLLIETPAAAREGVTDLKPPLVVDSQGDRVYATGRIEGVEQIVALSATSGRLVASYGVAGAFDVDPAKRRLYVDQGESGLLILDTLTGSQKALVALPPSLRQTGTDPAPEADPATGRVLAFRDNSVYLIDPGQATVAETIPFDIPATDDCRSLTAPLPIEWAAYDDLRRLLYLSILTYSCIPWIGESLVSFDMSENAVIAQGTSGRAVVAFDGNLYGSGWDRMGNGYRWAWRDGQPWFVSEGWTDSPPLFVDDARGWLHDCSGRVFDLATMSLLFLSPRTGAQPCPQGSDPGTGRLFAIEEGELVSWSAGAIEPPSPQVPETAEPPAEPVRQLVVATAGPQAPVLFGLWDYGLTEGACYLFGANGGLPYQSADGGLSWARPRGGLDGACDRFSALAVSPEYATDQTLFAALVGSGIFRSTDGGQLWMPASAGLTSMLCDELLLSPGFASDRTLFARCHSTLQRGDLYRSSDSGATWEPLDVDTETVAMSPEFDQDGVLMATSFEQILLSHDRGETWESLGSRPRGPSFAWLSLAPWFRQWQVVFALGGTRLYRSANGGQSWDTVLSLEGDADSLSPAQIVYGPETEAGRLLFLLATRTDPNADPPLHLGALYWSEDGGQRWNPLALPEGFVPTALAISPTFGQDGLLWIGTADGRVVAIEAALLESP